MWLHVMDVCYVKLNPEDCGWLLDGHFKAHMVCRRPNALVVLRKSKAKDNNEDLELDFSIDTSDESESE